MNKDLNGNAITRWVIDDTVDSLGEKDVIIHCDAWAFRKIYACYEGWLNIPNVADGVVFTTGVHPVTLVKFFLQYSKEQTNIKFVDEVGNELSEIDNYSRSC